MLSLLEKAIEKNELYLKFQPKVDSRDNSIVGAEALIRWNNRKLGNVSPSIFIPLAEENGMIKQISCWVVHELCSHIKEWEKKKIPLKPVSFNLSPYDFAREDFPECLFECLKECEVDSKNIEIEITEGVLVKNTEDVARKIDEIKSKGIKILLDDFGTGYSSLEYLKKFNIDVLKIDRAFIKDYPDNSDGTIARTVCELAHSLNMKVICEGVKTKAQVDFLDSIGCHIIQGFYYSPAVTSDIFQKMLKKGKISPHHQKEKP
jgi:EAL domain-containing protein (putative c-di-GMP-specific phosphodiesterase class I)